MSGQAMLKKGSSHRMEVTVTSPGQARRISSAMKTLQSTPFTELERVEIVKKLKVSNRDDIYAYRVGPMERIVFSPVGSDYIIHDIVSFDSKHSAKSLLVGGIEKTGVVYASGASVLKKSRRRRKRSRKR